MKTNSECQITPKKQHNLFTHFKCFNCFGQSDNSFCVHCGGTGSITKEHPMALLLNQVIDRKLNNIKIIDK